jgi:hypothetical protein
MARNYQGDAMEIAPYPIGQAQLRWVIHPIGNKTPPRKKRREGVLTADRLAKL